MKNHLYFLVIIICLLSLFACATNSTKTSRKTGNNNQLDFALLIINAHNDYFEGGSQTLHNSAVVLDNIEIILNQYRAMEFNIIYVQHLNTEIHHRIKPLGKETIIVLRQKENFVKNELHPFLIKNGIKRLIICGMLTNESVAEIVNECRALGIRITLITDACAAETQELHNSAINELEEQTFTLITSEYGFGHGF